MAKKIIKWGILLVIKYFHLYPLKRCNRDIDCLTMYIALRGCHIVWVVRKVKWMSYKEPRGQQKNICQTRYIVSLYSISEALNECVVFWHQNCHACRKWCCVWYRLLSLLWLVRSFIWYKQPVPCIRPAPDLRTGTTVCRAYNFPSVLPESKMLRLKEHDWGSQGSMPEQCQFRASQEFGQNKPVCSFLACSNAIRYFISDYNVFFCIVRCPIYN